MHITTSKQYIHPSGKENDSQFSPFFDSTREYSHYDNPDNFLPPSTQLKSMFSFRPQVELAPTSSFAESFEGESLFGLVKNNMIFDNGNSNTVSFTPFKEQEEEKGKIKF